MQLRLAPGTQPTKPAFLSNKHLLEGANRLARFPSTLTQASHLRVVFLANQMPDDHAVC